MRLPALAPPWLLLLTLSAQEPATLLRHHFAAGEEFAFAVTVATAVEVAGAPAQTTEFRFEFAAKVLALAPDGARVDCRIQRIVADVGPSNRVDYDSSRPAETTPSPLAQLLHQELTVTVDARDGAVAVEAATGQHAIARQQLGTDFTALLASWFVPLPAAAIAEGKTWTTPWPIANAPVCVQHRVADCKGARVRVERTVHLATPKPTLQVAAGAASGRGLLDFDAVAGRVVTATLEVEMTAITTASAAQPARRGTTRLCIRAEALPPAPRLPADAGRRP